MREAPALLLVTALVAFGCDTASVGVDGGADAAARDGGGGGDGGGSEGCDPAADDCSDGLFCNGEERCDPTDPAADERGCVRPGAPCESGMTCEEGLRECIPEGCLVLDADGDGHRAIECGGDDCDDTDGNRFPGNVEVCDGDGHDEDCNPNTFGFIDADGDGAGSAACCNGVICGTDCNDADSSINPGVGTEFPLLCDGIDNNCDGVPDEGCPCVEGETMPCGTPAQLTRTGLCRPGTVICAGGAFTAECIGGVQPQEEVCDDQDNDCDGTVDDGVLRTYFTDADGDGFGATGGTTTMACSPPPGFATSDTDCDDTQRSVSPLSVEVCNAVDDDCDGTVDEGVRTTYYRDADGDAFGDPTMPIEACARPAGYASNGFDCDDTARGVNPPALEVCDGIDNDCDTVVDPGCACTNGATRPCGASDGAGGVLAVGECAAGTQRCIDGTWASCVGATTPRDEVCNGLDDDCDGGTDEGVQNTYYRDADGDGFGSASVTRLACTAPVGFVGSATDCDDTNAAISPAAVETCDLVDNNCDTVVDPGCACTDGTSVACGASDGMGGINTVGECVAGSQLCVAGALTGCAGAVLPRVEVCNGVDDDCDGSTDEGTTVDCWADPDDDGWPGAGAPMDTFCPVAGRAAEGGCPIFWTSRPPSTDDCADDDPSRNPGAAELCNLIDDDCDGVVDEDTTSECAAPNAHGACLSGSCAIVGCQAGFGDCNGARHDGCEVDVRSDSAHCSACRSSCGGGACGAARCELPGGLGNGGFSHMCAWFSSGRLACWGSNDFGQLGDGGSASRPFPASVIGVTDALQVDSGENFACAVRAGGTVSCWGYNLRGQLGDGTTSIAPQGTPRDVVGLTGAAEVDGGALHTCARLSGGAVRCWGWNSNGQLGDGTTTDRTTPVAVSGLSGAVSVTAGTRHSCAVLSGGGVRCWGQNAAGQLGDGTTTDRPTPVAVVGISNATRIASYADHNCVIRGAGSVSCWGAGALGALGDGAMSGAATPVNVVGLTDAIQITVGQQHSCALRATGQVVCWGRNLEGQLGDGTTVSRGTPAPVTGLTGVVAVGAGSASTCALRNDGSVWCWGRGSSGEIGDGTLSDRSVPTRIPTFGRVFELDAGAQHSCVRRATGEVLCWGHNLDGEIGDGTTTQRTTPVSTVGSNDYVRLSTSMHERSSTCAVRANGQVECWGDNFWGQLGDGTTGNDRPTPVTWLGVSDAVEADAGAVTTCVLRQTGQVSCQGRNLDGARGSLGGIGDAIQVAAGSHYGCVLHRTGRVSCWGRNTEGQAGHPGASAPTPVEVAGLVDATTIDAGRAHTCARRSDRTVACWGSNTAGQLGDGLPASRSTPAAAIGLSLVEEVVTGADHTCARRATGELYCWGANESGQLGDGSTSNRPAPLRVPGLGFVERVSAGQLHTCVQLGGGQVGCWGANDRGQLGDGTTASAMSFVPVAGL